ncbi:MAG: serine--tRNA ligase, partial [Nitrospira sp.]|nr:serine--tRNA ligase [Nitrospira sp.]
MLDPRFVREHPEKVIKSLEHRGYDKGVIESFLKIEERRALLLEVERLRQERNELSEKIALLKQKGADVSSEATRAKTVSDSIKLKEERLKKLDDETKAFLLTIPNIPHESVPIGKDETENAEIHKWGEPRQFDFEPLNHWDIGEMLEIIDFERASKIAGARFALM